MLTPRFSPGRFGASSRTGLEWTLILCCVFLAVFFVLACAFDDDGDFGVIPCRADEPSCSPDEASHVLPARDAKRLLAGPAARLCLNAPGLLAAVPGGLCLLI